jgi:RNase P subunit RPR2
LKKNRQKKPISNLLLLHLKSRRRVMLKMSKKIFQIQKLNSIQLRSMITKKAKPNYLFLKLKSTRISRKLRLELPPNLKKKTCRKNQLNKPQK